MADSCQECSRREVSVINDKASFVGMAKLAVRNPSEKNKALLARAKAEYTKSREQRTYHDKEHISGRI